MVKYSYDAFWKAFFFSTIVFILGLNLGVFVESSNLNEIERAVISSEVELYDSNIRSSIIQDYPVSCEKSIDNTFKLADKIYEEVILLENLDESSALVEGFFEMHKRYDLLRLQLWLDSSRIKTYCENEFNLIIYLYEYDSDDPEKLSLQNLYASITGDLKSNYRENVLLIPIAYNMDLNSLDIILENYNLENQTALIINDKYVITDAITYDEVIQYINWFPLIRIQQRLHNLLIYQN